MSRYISVVIYFCFIQLSREERHGGSQPGGGQGRGDAHHPVDRAGERRPSGPHQRDEDEVQGLPAVRQRPQAQTQAQEHSRHFHRSSGKRRGLRVRGGHVESCLQGRANTVNPFKNTTIHFKNQCSAGIIGHICTLCDFKTEGPKHSRLWLSIDLQKSQFNSPLEMAWVNIVNRIYLICYVTLKVPLKSIQIYRSSPLNYWF